MPQQLYKTASRGLSVIAELLVGTAENSTKLLVELNEFFDVH